MIVFVEDALLVKLLQKISRLEDVIGPLYSRMIKECEVCQAYANKSMVSGELHLILPLRPYKK
jgi:hypothetical protein